MIWKSLLMRLKFVDGRKSLLSFSVMLYGIYAIRNIIETHIGRKKFIDSGPCEVIVLVERSEQSLTPL